MSLKNHPTDALEPLVLADPNIAEKVRAVLEQKEPAVSDGPVKLLVEEALWGPVTRGFLWTDPRRLFCGTDRRGKSATN